MLNIFLESSQTLYWVEQSNFKNHTICRNISAWLSDTKKPKVALLEVFDYGEDTISKIKTLCQHAKTVLLFVHELLETAWIKQFDLPNVVFYISGVLNFKLEQAGLQFYPYFFSSTIDFYRANTAQFDPNTNALFDVLLGRRKPHRDIIYNNVDHNKNVVRYFPEPIDNDIRTYKNTEFEWPTEQLTYSNGLYMTADEVQVNGTIVSLSQIIPTNIYNRTRYSLVAETCADNDWSFFTEKIVKPMLAKRLFVVASGQYYLQNLRSLGFKTFENIIDESYDSIADMPERMQSVCNTVKSLEGRDPYIAAIVDHNYHHLMNTNWYANMFENIKLNLLRL